MNKKEALEKLNNWEYESSIYEMFLTIANFDSETIAPKAGGEYRNKRIADFATKHYELKTDAKIYEVLTFLKDIDLDEEDKRRVELYLKDFEALSKVPKDFFTEYQMALLKAGISWHEAKDKDDYKLFKEDLIKNIQMTKEYAGYIDSSKPIYDVLLNEFEEGSSMAFYDEFFALIKERLLPLIARIKDKHIDDEFLYRYYPKDGQAKVMDFIKEYLGFDESWGAMALSLHPFSTSLCSDDCRVTTHYDEYSLVSSIYSIVHEIGHAYYEHQVNPAYDGTSLKRMSFGAHESQSRFFENYLGKRKAFIAKYYDYLKEVFPTELKDVSLDQFYKAASASKPSLIRIDADELTYPIHILIRYELEKKIFANEIDLDKLDEYWNKAYKDYLGLDVTSSASGILQDIHWSSGYFGYFPTYALGSAIGAQLLATMQKDIDIDECLSNDVSKITAWLKDNFQKYGALYKLDELLKRSTGQSFNPHYYIDHLVDKYTKLYELD